MTNDVIHQAQERLKTLKAESTQGVWRHRYPQDRDFPIIQADEAFIVAHVVWSSEDGDLIEVLHRTIDAQLEILQYAEELIKFHNGNMLGLPINPAISLAKAILGVE